jgi:hypothetical protein
MIEDMLGLRRALDAALTAIEPLLPVITAWKGGQDAQERAEEEPRMPADGSVTPDGAPRRRRGRPPKRTPEERRARQAEGARAYRARKRVKTEAAKRGREPARPDDRSLVDLEPLPDAVERSWVPTHVYEPPEVTALLAAAAPDPL